MFGTYFADVSEQPAHPDLGNIFSDEGHDKTDIFYGDSVMCSLRLVL